MSLSERAIEALIELELENHNMREQLQEQDDGTKIRAFWACGDNATISYAIQRARLNRNEREALSLILDECMTQEEAAERLGVSTRSLQAWWRAGTGKILNLPWARAYATELARSRHG